MNRFQRTQSCRTFHSLQSFLKIICYIIMIMEIPKILPNTHHMIDRSTRMCSLIYCGRWGFSVLGQLGRFGSCQIYGLRKPIISLERKGRERMEMLKDVARCRLEACPAHRSPFVNQSTDYYDNLFIPRENFVFTVWSCYWNIYIYYYVSSTWQPIKPISLIPVWPVPWLAQRRWEKEAHPWG